MSKLKRELMSNKQLAKMKSGTKMISSPLPIVLYISIQILKDWELFLRTLTKLYICWKILVITTKNIFRYVFISFKNYTNFPYLSDTLFSIVNMKNPHSSFTYWLKIKGDHYMKNWWTECNWGQKTQQNWCDWLYQW